MLNTLKSFLALLSFTLLLTNSMSFAQTGLLFEQQEVNLGYIPEDTGTIVVDFYFSNASTHALLLKDVETQGGATLLTWPKDSIQPGQKTRLSVKINPNNRPGSFERKVTLRSMPDSASYTLSVKSYVEPVDKVWNENTNETQYGSLVVSSDYIRLGNISENSKVDKSIKVKNIGKEPVSFLFSKAKVPSYILMKGLPDKLLPGTEVTLTLTIDIAASKKLGKYIDMLEIPMGKGEHLMILYVIGKIIPFSPATANKPIVELFSREVNLNDISTEKPIQGSFVMKNVGLSPLIIRQVETSCLCINMEYSTAPIAPGAGINLYFTFDPRGLTGIEEKRIILYTNAPDQPIISLLVKAKVSP